jgi:hypothetical protein
MGKKSAPAPPPPPDYKAIAQEQAKLDEAAAQRQTAANRINQYNPYGSLTFETDPTTGQTISQTEKLSPEQQALYDQQVQYQQAMGNTGMGLIQGVQNSVSKPFDMSGLSDVQGLDPSKLSAYGNLQAGGAIPGLDFSSLGDLPDAGFGAVESVRDAMMSRLRPGLESGRAAEIARLKAQGFNEGDEGLSNAMNLQNQRANDAEQQALLGAAGEYGNIFNRALQGRQQSADEMYKQALYGKDVQGQQFDQSRMAAEFANKLRGQQLDEQGTFRNASVEDRTRGLEEMLLQRQLPLQELQAFMQGVNPTNPQFENYSQGTQYGAADISGAADKQYKAEMDAFNAQQAAKANKTGGLLSMAGTVAGGIFGGPIGASLGGMLTSKLGGTPPRG